MSVDPIRKEAKWKAEKEVRDKLVSRREKKKFKRKINKIHEENFHSTEEGRQDIYLVLRNPFLFRTKRNQTRCLRFRTINHRRDSRKHSSTAERKGGKASRVHEDVAMVHLNMENANKIALSLNLT